MAHSLPRNRGMTSRTHEGTCHAPPCNSPRVVARPYRPATNARTRNPSRGVDRRVRSSRFVGYPILHAAPILGRRTIISKRLGTSRSDPRTQGLTPAVPGPHDAHPRIPALLRADEQTSTGGSVPSHRWRDAEGQPDLRDPSCPSCGLGTTRERQPRNLPSHQGFRAPLGESGEIRFGSTPPRTDHPRVR